MLYTLTGILMNFQPVIFPKPDHLNETLSVFRADAYTVTANAYLSYRSSGKVGLVWEYLCVEGLFVHTDLSHTGLQRLHFLYSCDWDMKPGTEHQRNTHTFWEIFLLPGPQFPYL